MPRSPYAGPYDRLARTIHEPENEQACWVGTGRKVDDRGYIRMNFHVPGAGGNKTLTSHVALWILLHYREFIHNIDDLYLACVEFRMSGLELDHQCFNPSCRNPDHLLPEWAIDNNRRKRRTANYA